MTTPEWRDSEVLAWTEHEGPGRGPSRGRTVWFWLAGGMAAVFAGIMSSDTLCPEHRLWVLLLGGGALIAAGAAIVGLISGWAGAPLLALASALGGVGIGLIDTLHSAARGRTIALAFALVFVGAAVLVWRQHRQHRWDRDVARSLRVSGRAPELAGSGARGPARLSALRRHLLVRLAIGAPLVLLAAAGLVLTTANAREARAFEERAARLPASIVDNRRDEGGWRQHVTVLVEVDGHPRLGRAPVLDSADYEPGQSVVVLYEDRRVLLAQERYDAASPALWWSAILFGGLLTLGMGWWWVHRCRRTAAGPGPAFAMEAAVGPARPRWWNRRRPWVTLFPLHGATPVGAYPLMSGVPVATPSPGAARVAVDVKGNVRDGGLVVARSDGQVLWPQGRLRT